MGLSFSSCFRFAPKVEPMKPKPKKASSSPKRRRLVEVKPNKMEKERLAMMVPHFPIPTRTAVH
ncbi:hypothetical protein HPP92_024084 [Vanilla planifolia]|uniref:Uncharacterized protein n=1 Tax=Vanilla planifolia TaxID=51239 RepID=A0A835UBI0_VANPL|nr:hypothetical protein HPP92_024402 [Vanilla planifolia]KAG0456296.1 hypothetical protein HPP92_024084 [Vanilla planifolia]